MTTVAETYLNSGSKHWRPVTHAARSFTKVGEPLVVPAQGVGIVAQFLQSFSDYLWNPETDAVPTLAEEDRSAPSWIGDVYSMVEAGEIDRAVDVLFEQVDDLLLAGDFKRCNELLLVVDPKRLDTHLMVSFLAVTTPEAPEHVRPGRQLPHLSTGGQGVNRAPPPVEATAGTLLVEGDSLVGLRREL